MASNENVRIGAEYLNAALRALIPGADFARDNDLAATPARLARALAEMTSGYTEDPAAHLQRTFDVRHDELVLVRDIPFASLCEHHVLPFAGTVSVAYIPQGRIVGLSKIPRMVAGFARRLQVQERLTTQVAEAMERALGPKGVAVHVRGNHSCMQLRGARTHGEMVTSSMRGVFRNDASARAEVLSLMGVGR